MFASRARVAERGVDATRLRLAPDVRIVREYAGTRLVATRLRQLEGMCLERDVSTDEAEAARGARRRRTRLGDALLELVEELVELGFLEAV